MNEYWLGVLTIPALLLALAAVAAALFGAWLLYEKWAEHRIQKLPEVKVGHRIGGAFADMRTVTELGGRGIFAALLLSVSKVWFMQLGPNTGIGIVHGKGNEIYETKFMSKALTRAIDDLAREQEEAK